MKKILLIYPPFWVQYCPHIALPLLSAQLRAHGFNSEVMDLNIDFYSSLSAPDFIELLLYKIKTKMPLQFDTFKMLSGHLIKHKDSPQTAEILKKMLETAFSSDIYQIPYQKLNYEGIKDFILDKENNFFLYYFEKILENITSKQADCIGIGITSDSQFAAGLTLAHILKKEGKGHILLGGNYINRIKDGIKKYPNFFDFYADSILYGECETAVIDFARYINNEAPAESVPNLIYKNAGAVIENKPAEPYKLSEIYPPDYSSLDLRKYHALPLTISRGCYWRKCSFCDMAYSNTYSIKPVNAVIEELKQNRLKYGMSFYEIIDESVPPKYLEKFSEAVIKNNLNINFKMFARFEKEFKNPAVLNKAYQAGLREIEWGLESANKRVLKLINKGIDLNDAAKILEISNKAGIHNQIDIFFGFPSETFEEAMDTIKFAQKNRKNIKSCSFGEFGLGRHCKIAEEPEKYGVKIHEHQLDFSHALGFQTKSLSADEKNKLYSAVNKLFYR